jgi:hypothetical protein
MGFPPMKAAASAGRRYESPVVDHIVRFTRLITIPVKAASTPEVVKMKSRVLLTLMPMTLAASLLSPMAKMCAPVLDRLSSTHAPTPTNVA